ncbi:MAG TPA: hypothetical protein PLU49_06730 [Saprospiraceae bacterium]|nr:hypothetical protein [Saprospiraceae bacterium]
MITLKQTVGQYFRALTTMYLALLAGQIVLFVIFLYLNLTDHSRQPDPIGGILKYLVAILVINGFVVGQLIYKKRLIKLKSLDDLAAKLEGYRGAMIMRLALLEGPSLLTLVLYFLTADLFFIMMAGFIIFIFLFFIPSRDKISRELELSSAEKMKIENPDALINEI